MSLSAVQFSGALNLVPGPVARTRFDVEHIMVLSWPGQLILAGLAAFIALLFPLFAADHASLMALADPTRRIASFAALGLLILAMLSYAMKRHKEENAGRYSWVHRLRER